MDSSTSTSTSSTATAGFDMESAQAAMRESTMQSIAMQNFGAQMDTMKANAQFKTDAVLGANATATETSNGLATGMKSDAQKFGRLLG